MGQFEEKSFVKDLATTLTVVYGGETMTCEHLTDQNSLYTTHLGQWIAPLLGLTPSFMVSGVVPALYASVQALVEILPTVPAPSLGLELPLAVLDGFTRAYLLCNLIPPAITTHTSPVLAASPWTLLLTSLITANGGFFLTNMFSFLHPTPLTLTTPAELQPYGWTTTDLWCAPLITGIFALLTHAQPFWADLHVTIIGLLGGYLGDNESKLGLTAAPVDPETARAVCAIILVGMFTTRTFKNFAGPLVFGAPAEKVGAGSKTVASYPSPSGKQLTASTRCKMYFLFGYQ
ncbi:hypothetical protein HWV62_45029 [Athelia sp. TMB]|nr:hypothetical protein HWV62_45029 [Athelia sp. TMB]